ncbi:MAG: NUDIX domain-containing protein [Candidatus Latescibacteria bacterium]|nr:NUDIX domain-containing protein [Candidatus Latescibacterota bacterium]
MGMSDFYRGLRERVGPDLLLVPAVAAVIRDHKGQILIQERPDGSWSLPAGAIEPGESPPQAMVREVYEETGLHVRPERVVGVLGGSSCRVRYENSDQVEYVVTVFACSILGGDLIQESDETRSLAFVQTQEALSRLRFPYPEAIFDESRPDTFFQQGGGSDDDD